MEAISKPRMSKMKSRCGNGTAALWRQVQQIQDSLRAQRAAEKDKQCQQLKKH